MQKLLSIIKFMLIIYIFSGRGGVIPPHWRYNAIALSPRALSINEVSRSGVIPEPTVIVRMEEIYKSTCRIAALLYALIHERSRT